MPTRYIGLFCPKQHFNIEGSYEVEHPEAAFESDFRPTAEFYCKECKKTFPCQQSDVAHSNWPDGSDARYPHRP